MLPGSSRSGENARKKSPSTFSASGPLDNRAFETALFKDGQDQFLGGARIRGGFKDDELALLQMRVDGDGGVFDVAQVGFASFVERGGDADDDGVDFLQLCEISGSAEVLAVDELLDFGLWDVLDIRLARVEHRHLFRVGVKSGDLVARFGEAQSEGEADVSAANDADFKLAYL